MIPRDTLKDLFPEVANQWNHSRNGNLTPENTTPKANHKVWWTCDKGHEWEATVASRTRSNKSNCPYCLNKRILVGYNDLSTVNPILGKQWHPTKNNLAPSEVSTGSHAKVWWQCDKGHEWEATIINRSKNKNPTNCPYCTGSKASIGVNDLKTQYPDIAKEWHPTKNLDDLTKISRKSNRKVWWLCDKGHEWANTVVNRTHQKQNCPYCTNRKVTPGYNDIKTTSPALIKDWDHSKNLTSPDEVTYGSDQKIWWLCENGHSWQAHAYSRAKGKGCPVCANRPLTLTKHRYVSEDLQLMSQWHPTRNDNLTPATITCGSGISAWWVCQKGHEWKAPIYSRKYGKGCSKCSNRVSNKEKDLAEFLRANKLDIETGTRNIITPYELDMFIPSKNIAIEFNGIYWHTENQGKNQMYHYNKWLACKEKGIQLIQIWEDDWDSNKNLVKRMLLHKLKAGAVDKVYARKTKPASLTVIETRKFLEENHIQGATEGSVRLGLKVDSELVAVMILKQENNGEQLNLVRFATSKSIPGGFTKLLREAVKRYPNVANIVTFSDNTISDGGLYEQNGFSINSELKPDYMYVSGNKRIHKFNYRIKKFKNDPELEYVEGLSERELALLNNLPRIWDAGKTKWVLTVKPQ